MVIGPLVNANHPLNEWGVKKLLPRDLVRESKLVSTMRTESRKLWLLWYISISKPLSYPVLYLVDSLTLDLPLD